MLLKSLLILLIAVALLFQSGAQAQDVSLESGIKARGRGSKLVLNSRGKTHVLDVSGQIDAAKLDDVDVIFASRKPPFTYLLVSACGSSRLKSNDRQCGAGLECNLLWLKLNSNWRISDIKSAHYESCWTYITSTEGYKTKDHTLEMDYNDFNRKINYKLSYDALQPENGFILKESEITNSEPD